MLCSETIRNSSLTIAHRMPRAFHACRPLQTGSLLLCTLKAGQSCAGFVTILLFLSTSPEMLALLPIFRLLAFFLHQASSSFYNVWNVWQRSPSDLLCFLHCGIPPVNGKVSTASQPCSHGFEVNQDQAGSIEASKGLQIRLARSDTLSPSSLLTCDLRSCTAAVASTGIRRALTGSCLASRV